MDPESLFNIENNGNYQYSFRDQYLNQFKIYDSSDSMGWIKEPENYEIEFTDRISHKVIGKLEVKNGKLVFNGEMEESAKLFIEYINLLNA